MSEESRQALVLVVSPDSSGLVQDERANAILRRTGFHPRCLHQRLPPGCWWGLLPVGISEQRFSERLADLLVAEGVLLKSVVVARLAGMGVTDADHARDLLLVSMGTSRGGST